MENLLTPVALTWSQISQPLVSLISALVILLVGYILARLVGIAVAWVLKLAQFDKGAKWIGFAGLLGKGEVKKTASELVGDLLYWVILFIAAISAARQAGLPVDVSVVKLFTYLGLALLVTLILGLGLFFASFLSNVVKVVLLNFGVEGGKSLSRFIYYLVVIFAFLAALAQLGLRPSSIVGKLDIILGAPALAAAIAFGLGCKDMAADFLYGIFKGK
ncbi:hypothetical protein A2625_02365 [candidate division WOR-1 bacterium RIFCSPHIGHO2_01_FULL_53_15]|uniref:CmpX protein n=1 Tax=candidate division WOR-1 bacterium RIFCSPHIGHO2_01_FULL_53_15 TaxID=1802564 RepID=A0A1F4PZT1_UNCSA|nr:MAG: hypothetical protein A2625_02365 [candidate division WOR-1 bacterium RIFCSPHIGHO2_01_FULL_53_15]OGC10809.1 MAG: hypothetical protein A3D23_05445 [candidate division WOR-1 bacterium RIFCSPHIGHO2_02_FULL_53_26]